MRTSLLARASLVIALMSSANAGYAASPAPSQVPAPSPEASCPPPADHLLVSPVGAAWIGSFEGVFDYPDGPPRAVWSIDEVLTGEPPVTDAILVYEQPACDPIVSGASADRYLVTAANPAGPTTGDTVLWRIGSDDRVSPGYPAGSGDGSVYDVTTLEAARALVLSGQMPAGIPPTPGPCEGLAAASPGSSAASEADETAARTIISGYFQDVHAHRFAAAWDRLSADRQAAWGTFDEFKAGAFNDEDTIGTTTNERVDFCFYLEGHDFADADLSRVWVFEVTHGPGSNDWRDEWLVAPILDGTWRLWQVR